MNIEGIGSETVDLLFQNKLVKDIADLYNLTTDQLSQLERLGDKSAANIVEGIAKSKEVPFARVLFALGIRFVGETVAKKLAASFISIEALRNATLEQLVQIDEIGERIAQSVVDFFSTPANILLIERLQHHGICFVAQNESESQKVSDKLSGSSFVISGTFSIKSRDEIKALIEMNGGKNLSSVSAKTNFLVAGENMGPAKLATAEKLSVKIISEKDFLQMIGME
jgi:DNA ligase (NAD+)